jgi:hypothetical protein
MKISILGCAIGLCFSVSAFGQFGTPAGGAVSGNGQAATGTPASDALFSAIDTDGDGEITTRELRKAVASLKKLDTDKDGKITRAETLNNVAADPSASGAVGSNGQSRFSNGTVSGGGVNGGGYGSDPRPGAPNMMQYDRNGDGRLSADEMPANMRGSLRGADQNGNGQLDPAEVLAFQQRMNERARGQRSLPPGVNVGPQGARKSQSQP